MTDYTIRKHPKVKAATEQQTLAADSSGAGLQILSMSRLPNGPRLHGASPLACPASPASASPGPFTAWHVPPLCVCGGLWCEAYGSFAMASHEL